MLPETDGRQRQCGSERGDYARRLFEEHALGAIDHEVEGQVFALFELFDEDPSEAPINVPVHRAQIVSGHV